MPHPDWSDIFRRYILEGETPLRQNVWDSEGPETFVERLYKELGAPAEAREALLSALKRSLQERNKSALNRGMTLAALIPDPDFAPILQEIFFALRNTRENEWDDMALLALRAMQAIQVTLKKTDPLRAVWQAMWLALLGDSKLGSGDPKFGIAAFQGLRQLDTSIAFHYLNLLLRRHDLRDDDRRIILRGLGRDSIKAGINLVEGLVDTILELTQEEWNACEATLREAFGDTVVDQAVERANTEVEVSLLRDSDLVSITEGSELASSPLRYLHDRLFPRLAGWLRERIPVKGVSIWLVDEAEKQVHFRGQAGCPGDDEPYPPRIIKFGEFASGRVAQTQNTELIDLTDEHAPSVYMKEDFLEHGMTALLSVYAKVESDKQPPLSIVVNYFGTSVEQLRRLQEACTNDAKTVVRVCQRVFEKYANAWIADLTNRLTEKPMLAETANALVQDISNAIPLCDRIALYLFNPELRDLFLHTLYVPPTSKYPVNGSPDLYRLSTRLGDRITESTAELDVPIRIADLNKWGEAQDCTNDIQSRLKQLGLDELPEDQRINYLGVSLREPAPINFIGMLGGVVEVYRSVEKDSSKAFTPVGEHIVAELAEAATPFVLRAFNSERRFSQASIAVPSQLLDSANGADDLSRELLGADQSLRSDLKRLLAGWPVAQETTRSFFAFRTLRDRCKAFWPMPLDSRFDVAETAARLELQHCILTHDDILLSREPACELSPELLDGLEVSKEHQELLLELGLVLIPLVDRRQLSGILGLEFGSEMRALRAAKEINRETEEGATEFVRTFVMQTWIGHRRHLRTLFGASFQHLAVEAARAGHLDNAQRLFNFVAGGNARFLPNERSYGELAATALRRVPSDAKCSLDEECINWQLFADSLGGKLDVDVRPVELMAVPSAIRMILAASTAPVLWGGNAGIALNQDETSDWRYLKIEAPKNGHEDIRLEGLALTKGISEYRGWACKYQNPETLTVGLPSLRP